MKNKKSYDSIVVRLIISIVIIFIFMIAGSNYLINRKQLLVMEEVFESFSETLPANNKAMLLLVDSAQVQSTSDFKIYTGMVMVGALLIGSLTFAYIINKTLKPLKELEDKIAKVDIEDPATFADSFIIEEGPSEIKELSEKFDDLIQRTYKDYKRQKDFSSNVAHELRTPIAIMQAQLDVYRRKNISSSDLDFVETMDANLKRLKKLIDSVLVLSKKSKLNLTHINLDEMIDEIIFDLEDRAFDKDISLNYKPCGLEIYSDDGLLQRLIFNIVENAIKYNKPGGRVDIGIKKDKDELRIEVSDTGIGIKDEKKEEIFDLFYQVDDSRTKEGFGIGLSLSKDIGESLGAKIEVSDNNPQGSIFTIKFKDI